MRVFSFGYESKQKDSRFCQQNQKKILDLNNVENM